jgi:ankyrin repeat protein
MSGTVLKEQLDAVKAGDAEGLARLLASASEAPHARLLLTSMAQPDLRIIEILLEAGADPNGAWRGYRPLHALIQERASDGADDLDTRLACMDLLLAKGAEPELPAAFPPATAVLIAAFTGIRAFVDKLLAAGAQDDAFVACALGDAARLKRELKKTPPLPIARTPAGLTLLHCCVASRLGKHQRTVEKGLLACIDVLLEAGADPNAMVKSWSETVDVAYFACRSGWRPALEKLLKAGANASAALRSAAWNEDPELLDVTIEHGGRIDEALDEGRPVLNELVRWGQVRPALNLLERGASPNLQDPRGWTALHQAASRGNRRLIEALLEAEADPKMKDADGMTALDIAKKMRRKASIEALEGARSLPG